jgi:hypothetical protein
MSISFDSFDTYQALHDAFPPCASKYQLLTGNSDLARALRTAEQICQHFKTTTLLCIAA